MEPSPRSPRSILLYAAGSNGRGQLATADSQDANTFSHCIFDGCQRSTLPPGTLSVIAIRCGGNHSLALLSRLNDPRIQVWGCGDGSKGQLGPTYVHESTIFRPIALPLEDHGLSGYEISDVAACWETSFVVLTKEGQHDDVLISMGGDDFGDLGIGSGPGTTRKALPFHIINFTHILGPVSHPLSITNIAAGPHHAVVLLRAGNNTQHIAGWGAARHGQLGPLLHAPSGRAIQRAPSPVAINLPIDVQLDPVRSVRAGNQHTLFLHASGRVSTLGSDAKGQLRGLRAAAAADLQAVGCSWNGSYLQTLTGMLFSAGANAHGQLGREGASTPALGPVNVPHALRVVDFACGSEHVLCMLESEGQTTEVWGWGWNEHGNLATGSLDDVRTPVKIWPPSPAQGRGEKTGEVVGVWAGCGTSWITVSYPASLQDAG